jgi:hypothetical protein
LATVLEEGAHVGEVAEHRLVDAALGADRQWAADLGDDDADLACGHLHPRVLLDPVDGPELEPEPRHEQVGLIAGLAVQGDRVAFVERLEAELLGDEPDLGGTDDGDRQHDHQDDDHEYRQDCKTHDGHMFFVSVQSATDALIRRRYASGNRRQTDSSAATRALSVPIANTNQGLSARNTPSIGARGRPQVALSGWWW